MTPYSGIFITDGLPLNTAKKRYKERRKKLLRHIHIPTVIFGLSQAIEGDNHWLFNYNVIFQDPWFLFLTGINQTNTALLLDPRPEYETEILFVPKKNTQHEFWEGLHFGIGQQAAADEIERETGFQHSKDIAALSKTLKQRMETTLAPKFGCFLSSLQPHEKRYQDNAHTCLKKLQKQLRRTAIQSQNLSPLHYDMRLCLDETDRKNLHQANKKTGVIFKRLLQSLPKMRSETQVAGFLQGAIHSDSCFGSSFPLIVASGKNACTLHYKKNNSLLGQHDLLLLDFGLKEHSMPADISRCIPVSGTFSPLQALLYNIVLTAQRIVEEACQAGVTINTLNSLCWSSIEEQLKQKLLAKGGKMNRFYTKAPHNVSHLIAHCVHDGDPHRHYQQWPLKPGMVISNEPGLYGHFELIINGTHYQETCGIRIEDNLLITKTGCENLSRDCPKNIHEIEALWG